MRGLARRSFSARVHAERYSDPAMLGRAIEAGRIEQKAARTLEKAKAHFEKQRPQWIAREYAKQKKIDAAVAKHGLAQGPRPPFGVSATASRDAALRARAEALVDLRQQRRLHAIEKSGRRMTREAMRGREHSQTRRR
jgi:hypothetical protein